MRVAIIGCGKIFPMHAYSIKSIPDVELVAIADTNKEKLSEWSKKLNLNGYTDFKEMIAKEEPDAIHICTPHNLHADMAIYALNKGIHVLTEKPAAITNQDGLKMLEAKKKNNRALVVSFQNRFNESSVLVKKEFEEKKLGVFLAGKAELTWNRSETYYSESGWKGTWEQEGGGLIIDQAIHTLDLVAWILGETPIVKQSFLDNWSHPSIEVEDVATVTLEYFGNKKFIFNGNNFYHEDSPIKIELLFEKAKVIFVGDQVKITYANGLEIQRSNDDSDLFNIAGQKQYWGTSHLKQIRSFYKELLVGNFSPKNSIEECLGTQELVENIYRKSSFSSKRK